MSHYPVITVPVVLWALDEEHDVSLFRPPLLLVGEPRVDDHVPVVEHDGIKLGEGVQLRAVVGDAAVGDGARGLEHGRAHPVPQPPVLSPEERREQEDVLHPGVVFEQFFKFGPIIKFGRKWILLLSVK